MRARPPGVVRQARRLRAGLPRRLSWRARDAGFAAVHRLGGGRAAVFHEGTILFSHVVRDDDTRRHTHARYAWLAEAVREALRALGAAGATSAPCPASTAPGDYSLGPGPIKLGGHRPARRARAACTQGVARGAAAASACARCSSPSTRRSACGGTRPPQGDLADVVGGVTMARAWRHCAAPSTSGWRSRTRAWTRRRSRARRSSSRRTTRRRRTPAGRSPSRRRCAAPASTEASRRERACRWGSAGRCGVERPIGARRRGLAGPRPGGADLDQLALAGDRLDDLGLLLLALAAAWLGVAGHAHAAGGHRLVAATTRAADDVAVLPAEALDVEPRHVDLVGLAAHGQLRSWDSLALQTARMFLADASVLTPASAGTRPARGARARGYPQPP